MYFPTEIFILLAQGEKGSGPNGFYLKGMKKSPAFTRKSIIPDLVLVLEVL